MNLAAQVYVDRISSHSNYPQDTGTHHLWRPGLEIKSAKSWYKNMASCSNWGRFLLTWMVVSSLALGLFSPQNFEKKIPPFDKHFWGWNHPRDLRWIFSITCNWEAWLRSMKNTIKMWVQDDFGVGWWWIFYFLSNLGFIYIYIYIYLFMFFLDWSEILTIYIYIYIESPHVFFVFLMFLFSFRRIPPSSSVRWSTSSSRGLVQGALASAATETLAASCNFLIGRNFLKDRHTLVGW